MQIGKIKKGNIKQALEKAALEKLETPKVEPVKVSIIPLLHKAMSGPQKARPIKNIHASALTNENLLFCPREYIICDKDKLTQQDQNIGTSLAYTFALGTAIQELINNKWLVDRMVGDWECTACKQKFSMTYKKKCACKCNIPIADNCNLVYREFRAKSEICGASCGIDALVDVGLPKLQMVEIKSIDKDQFKDLEAPKPEHRLRTTMYLRLLNESNSKLKKYVNMDYATVLYCQKAFGVKAFTPSGDANFSPFKEYYVDRDDSLSDTQCNKSEVVKVSREQDLIPFGVCPTAYSKRAHSCNCSNACFSGRFPPVVTWLENGEKAHPNGDIVSEL